MSKDWKYAVHSKEVSQAGGTEAYDQMLYSNGLADGVEMGRAEGIEQGRSDGYQDALNDTAIALVAGAGLVGVISLIVGSIRKIAEKRKNRHNAGKEPKQICTYTEEDLEQAKREMIAAETEQSLPNVEGSVPVPNDEAPKFGKGIEDSPNNMEEV